MTPRAMTHHPSGWTTNKPKEAGWYWWRKRKGNGEVEWCVCQEVYLRRGLLYATDCGYVKDLPGEWIGPITPEQYIEWANREGR